MVMKCPVIYRPQDSKVADDGLRDEERGDGVEKDNDFRRALCVMSRWLIFLL